MCKNSCRVMILTDSYYNLLTNFYNPNLLILIMCKLCSIKPVYEFNNKRKICSSCFINWFQKKFLYTLRVFNMVKSGDIICYKKGNSFREVALEDVLKMYAEKGHVRLVKINKDKNSDWTLSQSSIKKKLLMSKELTDDSCNLASNNNRLRIAIPLTSDTETHEVINEMFNSKLKEHKPVNGKIIMPLYLFLDKEVKLYAKLRGLKFKQEKEKKNSLTGFVNDLEIKHPELKQAVVSGMLKMK